jgi:hypothetical protein
MRKDEFRNWLCEKAERALYRKYGRRRTKQVKFARHKMDRRTAYHIKKLHVEKDLEATMRFFELREQLMDKERF